MASISFGKIVYPYRPRGQPKCSIVSIVFFFSFLLWDGSCSWANNIIKYGFRQREARLSTVKTGSIYLLLAEFSVRTVNYGPSFFPSIYGPSAKRAGHKSMEKNEDP